MEDPLKIISIKKMSLPKIAVIATGLTAAVLVATINPAPSAQANPNFGVSCVNCHTVAGGSVTAMPSTVTPTAGATFTVAIAVSGTVAGEAGYNISLAGVSVTTGGPADVTTFTANVTAPVAAGSYTYTVAANKGPYLSGQGSATTFTITVAATPTTTTTTPTTTTTTTPTTTTTTTPTSTTTTTPVPITKSTTFSYIASSRVGTAVYINTLIHEYSPTGVMSSPAGRVSYLQRYNAGVWQNLLARASNSTGRWTVGFTQTTVYQYRIVTPATSLAGYANSGSTFR
jgi:hypothetical protein